MAWLPISNTVLQYVDANGDPYSGAVLKFYAAGTSANIPVATNQTGTPTVTSVALNSAGFPEVSGNVVILFIDQDYKVALYPNQAAADSNTGAIWNPDNIDPFVLALPTNLTDINALTPSDGTIIVGDGTEWVAESGNTARTSLGLGTGDSPQFTNVTLSGLTTGHVVLANSAGALTALDVAAKGSLIVGDGAGAPVALAAGTNDYVLTADSAQSSGLKWAPQAGTARDYQAFMSSGTWTKPDDAEFVLVELWSAGGGGAANTVGGGAGGGSGGEYIYRLFQASALAATETVTIGAGGAGGAAAWANPGAAGGDTTFGSFLTAVGGNAGQAGDTYAAIPRSANANPNSAFGDNLRGHISPQAGYGARASFAGGATIYGGGGGGGGGATTAGGTSEYAGDGGAGTATTNTAGGGGSVPGGGGGGSGSSSASGGGGDGARGEARIWTW